MLGRKLLFRLRRRRVRLLFSQVYNPSVLAGLDFFALAQVLVDATGKVRQLAIAKKRVRIIRNALDEVAIVRDDHQGARP